MRPRIFLWLGGGDATGMDLRCDFGAVVAGVVVLVAGVGLDAALSSCECSVGVVIGERTPATTHACM